MRILQVNKFLYRRAGAEAYLLDLSQLLAEKGHEVALWGCRFSQEEQTFSFHSKFLVFENLLLAPVYYDRQEGFLKNLKKFGHMIWSFEAAKKFEALIKQWRPEIIHLHNIYHHLSPSILGVARRYRLPVVQTLHDFKLICPNHKLFTEHLPCQRCKSYRYWNALFHRCVQNSYFASGAAVIEMSLHRLWQIYEKNVAYFLTPSHFLRQLLISWGKNPKQIITLHNFVSLEKEKNENQVLGDYLFFAGRLTEEKGIWLLFKIAQALPEIKFKVAGTGPELKRLKKEKEKHGVKNFELLGFQEKEKVKELMAQARLVIVPSLWYENYSMTILEAQALGKAVLATATGGTTEMIEDGQTGFLIPLEEKEFQKKQLFFLNSSFLELWLDKIKKIYYDLPLLERVGSLAQKRVQQENNPETHYQEIIKIYQQAKDLLTHS
jgi:glycosyltransferase involved in cell wall biosynthesis